MRLKSRRKSQYETIGLPSVPDFGILRRLGNFLNRLLDLN